MRMSDWSSDVCSSDLGGYREIVLTGVDVTSFGGDLPGRPTLGQMMRRLLALVPELERLRLSSVDPVEIDDDLFRLLADEPRLMPHLHLSLQAGDDMVLKRMKRRHLRDDRSEEHTSELQSLMRISYAVFCLKKKTSHNQPQVVSPHY